MDDAVQNETITYTYDDSGNILSVNTYDYTTESIEELTPSDTIVYEYNNSDFPDELTSYDGQDITYDELGNPLSYLGLNMTWEAGRRLSTINNGTDDISYKYDDNGIRTSKTVNGVTTTYTSIDGKITSQDDGTNTIYYRYDKDDELTGFNLNETEYVNIINAQGDVTGILDTNGNQVVSYTYDAWGKVESITGTMADTVGQINPMRYRGYYQDEETGFYYLQSRYYNPVVERFINADEPALLNVLASSVAGANLFAYCGNNAVNNSDGNGCWSLRSLIKKAVKKVYNTAVYVTSYVPRKMWMLVVNNYLKPKKWYLSAELLVHSLQNNPSDLTYKSGSPMVKAIQNSGKFNSTINSIISKAKNNSLFYNGTITFTSGDLLGSLHKCNLIVGGNKKNGKWYLNISMNDYYDFAKDFSYYGGSLLSF